jgi:hypothetical protein
MGCIPLLQPALKVGGDHAVVDQLIELEWVAIQIISTDHDRLCVAYSYTYDSKLFGIKSTKCAHLEQAIQLLS